MPSRPESHLEFLDVTGPSGGPAPTEDVLSTNPPSRFALDRTRFAVAVGIAVIIGAVVGFVVGDHHGGSARPATSAASPIVVHATTIPTIPAQITDWLRSTGGLCGVQTGPRQLQLGVQFVNVGPGAMQVDRVVAQFPLGGLRLRSAGLGSACGQIQPVTAIDGARVPTNQPMWLLATLDITGTGCPGALPASFELAFLANGHEQASAIGGFSDLGSVKVSGC